MIGEPPQRVACDAGSSLLVVFLLDGLSYGLSLPSVERIVRVVAVTPLPGAPPIVAGVVNVQGRVIPVVDMRRRFRLPERAVALTDQMVVARTARRTVALIVDSVAGVHEASGQNRLEGRDLLPDLQYVDGVVKLDGELILIHDLDRFLSLEEETALEHALEHH